MWLWIWFSVPVEDSLFGGLEIREVRSLEGLDIIETVIGGSTHYFRGSHV